MPATDDFETYGVTLSSPLQDAVEIVPSDATDLANATRAIWVGGAGDIRVTMLGEQVVTFSGLGVGWHPLRVVRVHATATTASNLVGCW